MYTTSYRYPPHPNLRRLNAVSLQRFVQLSHGRLTKTFYLGWYYNGFPQSLLLKALEPLEINHFRPLLNAFHSHAHSVWNTVVMMQHADQAARVSLGSFMTWSPVQGRSRDTVTRHRTEGSRFEIRAGSRLSCSTSVSPREFQQSTPIWPLPFLSKSFRIRHPMIRRNMVLPVAAWNKAKKVFSIRRSFLSEDNCIELSHFYMEGITVVQ